MPKQNYFEKGQLTDVSYMVLLSLVEPKHGYSIMGEISELSQGKAHIGPASLYTTLKKLTEAGFISLIDSRDKKKTYVITDDGLSALVVEVEKRRQLADLGTQALNHHSKISLSHPMKEDL